MKKMRWLSILAALAVASVSSANSFTANGTFFEPRHDHAFAHDRNLISDGSFELGSCLNTPTWTCTSDNACDWITDLAPLGLWNYDGAHVAWLGGFCGGIATCATTICKELTLETCGLQWQWMAYVNDGGRQILFTIDGEPFFEYITDLADHLLGYQCQMAWIPDWGGEWESHTLCFEYHNEDGCGENFGDNYFLDYLEVVGWTTSSEVSLSAVKSMY